MILRPGVRIPCTTITLPFFNSNFNCNVKRTKINKKLPGLAHFLKNIFQYILTCIVVNESIKNEKEVVDAPIYLQKNCDINAVHVEAFWPTVTALICLVLYLLKCIQLNSRNED